MISRARNSSDGFTYIAALVMVVIMGIMLGAVGQSTRVIMQREREKELLFRGLQYRDAIERWNKKGMMPLLELKYLEKDPRSPTGEGHIRKLYTDPLTGGEWKTLPNPPDPVQGIWGVASTSKEEPFKQGDFPEALKSFDGKKKYSEWEFIFKRTVPTAPAAGAKVPGMPLSTPEGP